MEDDDGAAEDGEPPRLAVVQRDYLRADVRPFGDAPRPGRARTMSRQASPWSSLTWFARRDDVGAERAVSLRASIA